MNSYRTIFFLLFIVVGVLLVAGCDEKKPIESSTLTVVKLDEGGSIVWMKTINQGVQNHASGITSVSDGGFLIPGSIVFEKCIYSQHCPSRLRLIRLSNDGEILWDSIINTSSSFGILAFENTDHNFTLISEDGMIYTIANNGMVINNKSCASSIDYIKNTLDGGYILATGNGNLKIVKLNSDAGISWEKTYFNGSIEHLTSLVEMDDDLGYLGTVFGLTTDKGPGQLILIHLDRNGSVINKTWLAADPTEDSSPVIEKNPHEQGYVIHYAPGTSHNGIATFSPFRIIIQADKNGNITKTNGLGAPKTLSLLNDGSMIASGFSTSIENQFADSIQGSNTKSELSIIKYDYIENDHWSKSWVKKIRDVNINIPIQNIQTSDGGIVIIGYRSIISEYI